MGKRFIDLDTERAMKKSLHSLVSRLLYEVEAGKQDEEGAQIELAEFRKCYGFTEQTFKAYLETTLQKVRTEQMQSISSNTEIESESYDDDWPPREPDNSNNSKKSKK